MNLNCFMGERTIDARREAEREAIPERQAPRACVVCGGKPVLRVVGQRGYCGNCTDEAFEAAAKVKVGT